MRIKRIFMSLMGVIVCAVSVGSFKFASFGVDPFQTFMSGADALIPIGFGTLYVIVNAVLLLFSLFFDKHYIGIATLINLFFLGYLVDVSLHVLQTLIPSPGIGMRCLFFLAGFLLLCLGSSLYMTADLGVSTYDAIALICSNKWKIGKFRTMRILTDCLCIIFGSCMFLCSGNSFHSIPAIVGVGTIITAFCMGPLIELFNKYVSIPMLTGNADGAPS